MIPCGGGKDGESDWVLVRMNGVLQATGAADMSQQPDQSGPGRLSADPGVGWSRWLVDGVDGHVTCRGNGLTITDVSVDVMMTSLLTLLQAEGPGDGQRGEQTSVAVPTSSSQQQLRELLETQSGVRKTQREFRTQSQNEASLSICCSTHYTVFHFSVFLNQNSFPAAGTVTKLSDESECSLESWQIEAGISASDDGTTSRGWIWLSNLFIYFKLNFFLLVQRLKRHVFFVTKLYRP